MINSIIAVLPRDGDIRLIDLHKDELGRAAEVSVLGNCD
jgi:hypothetical protein